MSAVPKKLPAHKRYRVVSVEKTAPPEGLECDEWCCYVIQRGDDVLSGQKPGSLKEVTTFAKRYARELNERLSTVRGTSSYSRYRIKA